MPDQELIEYNKWRRQKGLAPLPAKTTGKKKAHLLYLSPEAWHGLQRVAWRHGLVWGRTGNVTMLLELIGQELIDVE